MKSKYKLLDSDHLYICGYGGSDMSGEWHSNGDLYSYISREHNGTDHNYCLEFLKIRGEGGYRLYVHLCLTCSNSNEYLLVTTAFRTLKECAWFAVEFIREYEQQNRFDKEIIPELDKKYRPVFVQVNNEILYVGDTIWGAGVDFSPYTRNSDSFKYYLKNQPDYDRYWQKPIYDVDNRDRLHVTEVWGHGLSSSTVDKEKMPDLYARIMEAINNHKKPVYAN